MKKMILFHSFFLMFVCCCVSQSLAQNGKVWLQVLRADGSNNIDSVAALVNESHEGVKKVSACDSDSWASVPKLEILFFRNDPTGGLRRALIKDISLTIPQDIPGFKNLPGAPTHCDSYGLVYGLSSSDSGGFLITGAQYRLSLYRDDACVFFELPAVPVSGITYRVYWNIDDAKVVQVAKPPQEIWVAGNVKGAVPNDLGQLMVRYALHNSQMNAPVGSDGSFRLKVPRLGGMMIVTGERADGLTFMYKQAVHSTNKLSFPTDADIVFDRKLARQCEFVITGISLEKKEVGLGIYARKEDPMPIYYMNLLHVKDIRKTGENKLRVPFSISCGRFWVKILGGDDGHVLTEHEITVSESPEKQEFSMDIKK